LEENLLSKKELLELTGISYGQLYRWKRKGLIPEEWFIRKATFTGQETFFPRHLILDRISKIVHMKDDLSLDEMADMFSPSPADVTMTADQLTQHNIVSPIVLELYISISATRDLIPFLDILAMYTADTLLRTGDISLDEARTLIETFQAYSSNETSQDTLLGEGEVIIVRKMGTSIVMITHPPGSIILENGAKAAAKLPLPDCVEQLKTKLTHGGESQ
jgi:DNA-binding transcriptional MerR regulator